MKKLFLCFILLLIPICVFAEDATQSIVDIIKAQIPALSEYDRFEATSRDGGVTDVSFYSQTGGFAAVSVIDGVVTRYTVQAPGFGGSMRLPNISKTEAAEIAAQFIKNAAKDIAGQLNTKIYTNSFSFTSGGYNLRFSRYINGIAYSADNISLFVDGNSGSVVRYSRVWNNKASFISTEGIITQRQAEESFIKNIGLELRYNRKTENKRVVPYLVYVPSNTGSIDAISGKAIYQGPSATTYNDKEMFALNQKASVSYSSVGSDSVEKEGLVSGNEAQQFARGIAELKIDDGFETQRVKYYKNTSGEFLITVDFAKENSNTSITLNAKSLQIINYYNSELASKKSDSVINSYTAKAIAESFLRKYQPALTTNLSMPVITTSGENNLYSVLYERTVGKIPYKGNSVQFLLNSSGEIASLNVIWDSMEFNMPAVKLNNKQVYDIFFKNIGISLAYRLSDSGTAAPVYIVNPQTPAIIDAITGEVLTYDGKPFKPNRSLKYIGLEGHYAKEMAIALADCDIFVSQGDVLLDGNILQKDFIALLAAIQPEGMPIYEKQSGMTDEDFEMIYNAFITKGIIEKGEVMPEGFVTRQEAVKYLLRSAGYKDVAELSGIFKMPFLDADEIEPKLYGYVSLARGLKLISGSGGYFKPLQNLTNADALVMIYNYLRR